MSHSKLFTNTTSRQQRTDRIFCGCVSRRMTPFTFTQCTVLASMRSRITLFTPRTSRKCLRYRLELIHHWSSVFGFLPTQLNEQQYRCSRLILMTIEDAPSYGTVRIEINQMTPIAKRSSRFDTVTTALSGTLLAYFTFLSMLSQMACRVFLLIGT